MTCKEAQAMVIPYINQELTIEELEPFLEHVRMCKECREELEIYYIAIVGVRQLDSEGDISNIKEELEHTLAASHFKVRAKKHFLIFKYAVSTLAFWGIVLTVLVQFRLWLENGFI